MSVIAQAGAKGRQLHKFGGSSLADVKCYLRRRVPFIQSCASWPLMIMTVIVMIVGIALPFSPLASYLQLQALPLSYFPWLVAILAGYMTLTQLVKGFYSRRYGWQ
ncbi:magnesium-transporting ATPase MgtA [Shigella sonnei]|nr:magnesium-transporting ATPase MgtA [Shigella sonnei]